MGEILSQEEIDALLRALSSGAAEAERIKEEAKPEVRLKVYDFRRPEKFSKDQIRTFHMIFSTFARLGATNLAGFLRSRLQIDLVSVDQLTYDEFVRSVPSPTFVCVFAIPPLEGRCVLQMSLDVVFSMIDRLLGGVGVPLGNLRPLTEIENRIMFEVVERLMSAFREAWANIYQVEPRVETLESSLEFVQIVSGSDMTVLFSFEVEVGERSGVMTICIPYIVVEPITQKLSASLWFASRKSHDARAQENIRYWIQRVRLPVWVKLGEAHIRLRELLTLEVGDVLLLERKVDEPLEIYVGKRLKMRGVPGRSGRRLAVKVTEYVEEEEP
ncbi:flagellar motor switch protein FliM [Candidatus Caldatribacterium sp.]|uniref:flagellar motor switch protein FliM n=1 Tax=Candidatus Caldatribacterium sp. TaxID=2282143 RepID=UPI002991A05F|nr:flagellar motor switch protein FliM [Candidatus Caldatribacterium sp.]MDW8081005.1 flagellar motor switch protein FliM [Candidatus Calescibacterium sp.]